MSIEDVVAKQIAFNNKIMLLIDVLTKHIESVEEFTLKIAEVATKRERTLP